MESMENGSHNSTRLSMYIRDMPLTPFGMSPTSEGGKKKKTRKVITTPGSNKLSRKNVRQPSSPCNDYSNKENEETPKHNTKRYHAKDIKSRLPNKEIEENPKHSTLRYHTKDFKSRLPNINDISSIRGESSQNSKLSSKTSTTSASHTKEILLETNYSSSVCALSLQTNSESSHSSERRESVFTDIDDGSFIEFCDIQAKPPICEPKKPPSSLYYTVESQNDTQYSTSTKMSNAAVGFKKYVDAVKKKRALLDIVTEDVEGDPDSTNKVSISLSDLSIVGGSADILPKCYTKTKNNMRALNSTMMPKTNQPIDFPDISTLTLETEEASSSDSNNPSPAASPNYINKPQANRIETITISESSEDESFMTANKSPPHEGKNSVNNAHKNRSSFHMELEATCDNSISQSVRPTPISQSLISEDVSIVSSVAHLCKNKKTSKSDATTVVYESVSVLEVPLRRSKRKSKETCETSEHLSKSKNNSEEDDTSRSKSPIYIRVDSRPNTSQRNRNKSNSKIISESDNPSNSSGNHVKSPRGNYEKISESEDLSDDVLRSPRTNSIHTMRRLNVPGNKNKTVNRERRKKTRSGKLTEVASDSSEENNVLNYKSVNKRGVSNAIESEHSLNSPRNSSKDSRYAFRSEEVSDSDKNSKEKSSVIYKLSQNEELILESDNQKKKSSLRNPPKKMIEESDESCSDVPKKCIDESDEISSDIVPVPKNTPNKYIWKIENDMPKKVISPDVLTNAKNPNVKQWIIKSPFKEGSFRSNFLLEINSQTITDSPSQPNPKNIQLKIKPGECSLKEKLDILDNKTDSILPKRSVCLEKSNQKVTSSPSISKRINSPVDTWVQTSPFKDSSLDSNFLLEDDNSYISETPSQPKNYDELKICSQSLELRLSEGFDKSNSTKISEKSKYTVGRIARSPKDGASKTKNKNADDSDCSIRVKRTPRTNVRIIDSDSESGNSEKSLQKVNKKSIEKNKKVKNIKSISRHKKGSKSTVDDEDLNEIEKELNRMYSKDWHKNAKAVLSSTKKQSKCTSETKTNTKHKKGSKSTVGDDELKEIEKELNKMYSKDWHKNANAVLSSTKKQNKCTSETNRSSRARQQNYKESETSDGSFISDEAEEASDEECSVDEEEPEGETLESESDDTTSKRNNTKLRDRIGSYVSKGENKERHDDTEKDGLDDYVNRRTVKKVESIGEEYEKQLEDPNEYESSFINDSDDDDDDSIFILPTLSQRLTTKINSQGGSLSSMLLSDEKSQKSNPSEKSIHKKTIKKDKKNENEVKKGKNLWSGTKGPLTPLDKKKTSNIEKSFTWRNSPTVAISSDSDDYELPEVDLKAVKKSVPSVPCWVPKDYKDPDVKVLPKTDFIKRTKAIRPVVPGGATPTQSFLSSLSSNINHGRCHPDAQIYVKNFKKNKESLSDKLYKYFNENCFDNKLPESMQIKWNVRMTKTAGFCYYQIDKSKPIGRGARIELSCKVLDKPERLRDTLVHEMCHAAAWIISAYKDGHGPLWKAWAAKVMIKFPELPSISRCHSYEISCKYTYRCTKCGYSIGRHSKSLDTNKKVCGYCYGKFEVILTSAINKEAENKNNTPSSNTPAPFKKTPNTPRPFALFVKENYGTVKKSSGTNLKHGEVMKILSAKFSQLKTDNK